MAKTSQDQQATKDSRARFWLSLAIPGVSIIGVVALAWIVLYYDHTPDTTKYVFVAILPLLGTWVGTVLAYHFSKDNFESASRSVQTMVDKVTPLQKLKATVVSEKMLKIDSVEAHKLKPTDTLGKLKLIADILERLENTKFNRLPILDSNNMPLLVIHRSTADQFISRKAREGTLQADLEKLELEAVFKEEPQLKLHSFVTVAKSDDLAEAKSAMEAVKTYNCLDVLVTEDGTKKSKVVGWLTNLIITNAAQV